METPTINIIQNDKTPENRKDIVLMSLKAIKDSNQRGNIDEEINALLYFIMAAIPEIPDNEYDRGKIWVIEPNFNDVKKEYLKAVNLIVPELFYAHIPQIERMRKEKYRRALQREAANIHVLLKIHTKWLFDETMTLTATR